MLVDVLQVRFVDNFKNIKNIFSLPRSQSLKTWRLRNPVWDLKNNWNPTIGLCEIDKSTGTTHPSECQDVLYQRRLGPSRPDVQVEAVLGECGGIAPPLLQAPGQLLLRQQLVQVDLTVTRGHHSPRLWAYFSHTQQKAECWNSDSPMSIWNNCQVKVGPKVILG